ACVDERAARIAGIDGRVRLDEILVLCEAHVRPAGGADNSRSDRLTELKRTADREDPFADFQLRRVSPWDDWEAGDCDFQERDVGRRVGANDLAFHLA